ncbi:ESPR domain-containing protein [Escherichia coli]
MNKIFKVIWNPATGNYTVTSETAKSREQDPGAVAFVNFCRGCGWVVVVV